jgi:hypothetical protein
MIRAAIITVITVGSTSKTIINIIHKRISPAKMDLPG